jgi:hypothetical protein
MFEIDREIYEKYSKSIGDIFRQLFIHIPPQVYAIKHYPDILSKFQKFSTDSLWHQIVIYF